MIDGVDDLYDYDRLRRWPDAAMYVARVRKSTLVLGGNQSSGVVAVPPGAEASLRRRRGGGGLVLLQPGDLWIDWWLPHDDPRWSSDVRVSSLRVGQWWATALREVTTRLIDVYDGPLEVSTTFPDVCFAGRGPGEVFVDGKKAVGLTQWRVREGVFVSTALLARDVYGVTQYVRNPPGKGRDCFDVATLATLGLGDGHELLEHLVTTSGPWVPGPITLEI